MLAAVWLNARIPSIYRHKKEPSLRYLCDVAQFATKAKRIIYYREIIAELLSRTFESPFPFSYGARHCCRRRRRYSIRNSHSKYKLRKFMVENFTAPMPARARHSLSPSRNVYNAVLSLSLFFHFGIYRSFIIGFIFVRPRACLAFMSWCCARHAILWRGSRVKGIK